MKKDASKPSGMTDADFIRRTFIFIGIVAFAAALYALSDILLLVFGAILASCFARSHGRFRAAHR
jgi:hypothetical protein